MTNVELMNLSIEELRDLNKRLVEVLKLKKQTIAFVNKETLSKGMIAEMVGEEMVCDMYECRFLNAL